MMMAQSKTLTFLFKTRSNAWWDIMMGNNSVVSKWKENFRLSQPTPSRLFGGILFLIFKATNSLLTIPS